MEVNFGWASETGTAIDLAREFIDECGNSGVKVASAAVLGEGTELRGGIWVLFVATTGQGQPPHSTRPFWKTIMKKASCQIHAGMRFLGS